jgi:ubiquinone biosynthesis protein
MMNIVTAVRDLARLREISAVLVRHGFGEIVARVGLGRKKSDAKSEGKSEPPRIEGAESLEISAEEHARGEDEKKRVSIHERVRLVLQDLGPSFIKLGQIISTRPDLIPPELIIELKKLQDDVPSVPFADIRDVVETSLGDKIENLFLSFDEKPLATASIGQVHRARLATPEGPAEVVVKVQRPGITNTVARDLELLHIMAVALERAIPETKIYAPVGLVAQFDRSITSELDFAIEAENAERFAQNFKDSTTIKFPKVYRHVSAKKVLCLEFFDGRKIDAALAQGFDGPVLAKRATELVIQMIFKDGFFHADPHPGNIIIMGTPEAPVIGLIDLGMVGRLSPELRDRAIDLMVAAARKDSYAVADAIYLIGRPTKKVDMREYRAEAALLAEKYLGKPLKEIELSSMIRDLVQGAMKYGIEVPTDFMLVGKALMTLEGIGKQLDPDLDVFTEASPHFLALLKDRYSPQRLGNEVWRGVEQLSRAGYDMPMQLREVLEDLRLGRLSVRAVDPELPRTADRLGRRLFSAAVVATLIGSGTVLLSRDKHVEIAIVMIVLALLIWLGHATLDLRRGPKR